MNINPIEEIYKKKLIAVVRADTQDDAYNKAISMIKGGINIIEITVERENLLPVIQELRKIQKTTILAGGIITSMRAAEAIKFGAQAIVSPVLQSNMLKFCSSNRLPHIATVSTPNEAYNAWKLRIPLIKIFPTKSMGGIEYIEDVLRPMSFLRLIPSGGLSLEDFDEYLKNGAIAVGLGRCLYKNATYDEITERCKYALSKIK